MNQQQQAGTGRLKKGVLIRAVILTGVFLILSFMAHGAEQRSESWYFPVSIFLSFLLGLFLYAGLPKSRLFQIIYDISLAVSAPFVAFVLVQSYDTGFWHVGAALSYETAQPPYKMIYLNLLFYYLIFLAFTFLIGSFNWGYSAASCVFMALSIVNFYVVKFRGSPIVPWDILSLRTAGNVASNYDYVIYWHMLFSTFGFAFVMLGTGKMKSRIRLKRVRFPFLAAAVLSLILLTNSIQNEDVKTFWGMDTTLFTPNVRYRKNGLLVAYLANLNLIHINKPDGYSVSKVKEIEGQIRETETEYDQIDYPDKNESVQEEDDTAFQGTNLKALAADVQSAPSQTETEKQQAISTGDGKSSTEKSSFDLSQAPNIIVIMNEAFSDLSVIGNFETSEDYMPFFHSMMDQYTGGHLMVSVKGGNTANTEYEFLSGDSMAFLPQGSVVYQQYISSKIPTLASYLGSLGYSTEGLHPYLGSGWDRERVYPLLGFDEFKDVDYFTGAKTIRKFVSDESAFDKIIEEFQNKGSQKKFIFEVTMQNHSGYMANPATDNGFTQELTLTGLPYENANTVAAERYLTLIKKSDEAYEKLITWFEQNVTEPTIIVTFGDHEPSDYVTDVIDGLTGYDSNTTDLEEVQKHYQVPFFIWNNMGIGKDQSVNLMSVNYLAAYIMKEAGLPMTDYQQFLTQLQKQVPVVCANTYIDADGTYHDWKDLSSDTQNKDAVNAYNILAYNHLVDVRHRVDQLFAEPADTQILSSLQKQTELLKDAAG